MQRGVLFCWFFVSAAGQGHAGSQSVLGTASVWGSLQVNAGNKNTMPWNSHRTYVLKSTTGSFLEAPAGAINLHCASAQGSEVGAA